MPQRTVRIASEKSFEKCCKETVGADLSRQEERAVRFLHYQIVEACKKSLANQHLNLAGTLLLTSSSDEGQRNHGIDNDKFGNNEARGPLARTIKAFYDGRADQLDELIDETNKADRQNFETISFFKEERMSSMRDICIGVAKTLAQKIYKIPSNTAGEDQLKEHLRSRFPAELGNNAAIDPIFNNILNQIEHSQGSSSSAASPSSTSATASVTHLRSGDIIIGSELVNPEAENQSENSLDKKRVRTGGR